MITYISVRGIPLLIKSPKTCKVFFRSIKPDKNDMEIWILFLNFIITAIKQYVHNIIKKYCFIKPVGIWQRHGVPLSLNWGLYI